MVCLTDDLTILFSDDLTGRLPHWQAITSLTGYLADRLPHWQVTSLTGYSLAGYLTGYCTGYPPCLIH